MMSNDSSLSRVAPMPTVTITVQPTELCRFRYGGRNESLTQLMGSSGTDHVTIRVDGYTGPYLVVVSLINPRDKLVHPHTIFGRDPTDENRYKCNRGILYFVAEESTAILNNISIQRAKKNSDDVKKSLKIRREAQIDPFGAGFNHLKDHGLIDFHAVRLCFQIFLPGKDWTRADIKNPKMYNVGNLCVTSNVVYEEKIYGDPKITYIIPNAGPVSGGTLMTLWCDEWKIRHNSSHPDVVFEDEQGWSQKAKCVKYHHRNDAIMFEAPEHPSYKIPNYTNNLQVKVYLQLPSPRGCGVSKSLPAFAEYLPRSFQQSIPAADYILQKKDKTMTWKQFATKSQTDQSNESPCTSDDWNGKRIRRSQPSTHKSLVNNNSNGECSYTSNYKGFQNLSKEYPKHGSTINPMSSDDKDQREADDASAKINQYVKEIKEFISRCPTSNGEYSHVSNGHSHLNLSNQALPNGTPIGNEAGPMSNDTNNLEDEGNHLNSDEIKELIMKMEEEYSVI